MTAESGCTIDGTPVSYFRAKTGRKNTRARMEKTMPAMVPMAKANQKTSLGPSKRKRRFPKL